MTIINVSPNRLVQIGYEGEDKVTILRFSYSDKWLENGDGIFTVRVLRNGENQAYDAQLIKDDRENNYIDMTVTDVELSKKGYGEMQLVYTGADFVKKSPVYKYYVSRSVDDAVDPPEGDVYTQIIESLSDLRINFDKLTNTVNETNDDIGDLTELTTANKLNIVESINEVNAKGFVSVDDELSDVSTNPVQNKVITARINSLDLDVGTLRTSVQGKADTQTVSALADEVNGLDEDVQSLQTTVQSKADTSTVTALSGTVSALSDAAQQYMEHTEAALDNKADVSAFNDLYGTVTGLQTSKADKSYVDTQLSGKASAQTVSDLADDVSDLQTGLAGKVGDVQVNGTSVVTDGVAQIPVMSESNYGVAKILNDTDYGIKLSTVGNVSDALTTSPASASQIKRGAASYNPIAPINQHYAVFYGLANAAGQNERNSELPLGQYTDEAKTAIQTMLDVPSNNNVVSGVQVDDVSVVTDGIANIPVAGRDVRGVASVRTEYGISILNKSLCISYASQGQCKGGGTSIGYNPITPQNQHWATFYGLAKVAGYDEKDSTLTVGTYSDGAKTAIRTMLGLQDVYDDYSSALEALGGGE